MQVNRQFGTAEFSRKYSLGGGGGRVNRVTRVSELTPRRGPKSPVQAHANSFAGLAANAGVAAGRGYAAEFGGAGGAGRLQHQ